MNVFVGRQPIYDKSEKVISYELLYRANSENNGLDNINESDATLSVLLNYFVTIGVEDIVENKPVFINFTEKLIKSGIEVFDIIPKYMVIEILETVEISDEIILKCKELKSRGYKIALDDFEFQEKYIELLKIADIVKIDFLLTLGKEREKLVNRIKEINKRIVFLAEKVESEEDYKQARKYGYSLFQGYYFNKPTVISMEDIPAVKINCLNVLRTINNEDLGLDELKKYIIRDVSISYKILRIVNSAYFGLSRKIDSVDEAINFVGENRLKIIVNIFLMQNICKENSHDWEILKKSLIRARFCEKIALKTSVKQRNVDAYIMGMFSIIDSILNRPLDEILSSISIKSDIRDALLKNVDNEFYYIYDLVLAYEIGNWKQVILNANKFNISKEYILESYIDSLAYTSNIIS